MMVVVQLTLDKKLLDAETICKDGGDARSKNGKPLTQAARTCKKKRDNKYIWRF